MGWSFQCTPGRLKDYLAELTCDEKHERKDTNGTSNGIFHVRKCLAKKYIMENPGSGRLWTVWEYWDESKWGRVLGTKTRYIGYDTLKCHARCWGNKSMSTTMGVGDTSCPLSYLEMVPEEKCGKKVQCPLDNYGDKACKCSGCHGCGACWDSRWRKDVLAAADSKAAVMALLKSLKPGDTLMLKGCNVDRHAYNQTDGKLPRGIRLRWIDYEKTLAAKHGIELED